MRSIADKEKKSHLATTENSMIDVSSIKKDARTVRDASWSPSRQAFTLNANDDMHRPPACTPDKSGFSQLTEDMASLEINEHLVDATLNQMQQSMKREMEDLHQQLHIAMEVRNKSEEAIHSLQRQNTTLAEKVENLNLELESRPTVKQWRAALQQIQEFEERIRDLISYRKESSAMESWKSHLSTAERMKIDKKNHELGIWLIESLPKASLVEIVQLVCRELDLSNVADVHPSLKKLKAVVRMVPQMEKIIHKVLTFLCDRNKVLLEQLNFKNADGDDISFAIGHIMPTLER